MTAFDPAELRRRHAAAVAAMTPVFERLANGYAREVEERRLPMVEHVGRDAHALAGEVKRLHAALIPLLDDRARLLRIEAAAREYRGAVEAFALAFDVCPCDDPARCRGSKRDGHYSDVCPYLSTQRAMGVARRALDAALGGGNG